MRKLTVFAPVFSGILIAAPFIVPSLFPVAWVSLLPLFSSLRGGTSRRGFVYGWVTGIVTNLVGFYWLTYTISVFGGFPYAVSAVIFAGFGVYAGIPFAIFSFLVRRYGFGPMNLFPPLFWVAIEFCFPLLFPWHLANSQSPFLTFIQSADLVGPYGASFLLMWANSVVFSVLTSPSAEKMSTLRTASILIVIIFACVMYGHRRLQSVTEEMRAARTLDVAAVQGSVNIHKKWDSVERQTAPRSPSGLSLRSRIGFPKVLPSFPRLMCQSFHKPRSI
jgi:apolipoprotein N-acyltransferase